MTIREHIEKRTGHYRRDVKVTFSLFLLGTAGMIILLASESLLKFGTPKPTWMWVLLGLSVILYGVGGLGAIAFALLMGWTAKCPKCNRRFRTLRKDWSFCPFCGANFDQLLEEKR
jgi:uncharacterized membrane protein YczE